GRGQRGRLAAVMRVGGRRGLLERGEPLGAGIDQAEIGGVAGGERVEAIDRNIVLARGGAQRKQPFLDPLKLARIVVGGGKRRLEVCTRVIERGERGIERLRRRLDQRRRLRRAALEPTDRGRERRYRGLRARHPLLGVAQIARHLLRLHHGGALFGERRLLRRRGGQPRQLL